MRLLPRFHPATLVAYVWARRAIARLGHDRAVPAPGVVVPTVAPPPRLPVGAVHGVSAALHHTGSTCLPRALLRQAWWHAHGDDRDLVIGVTAPSDFRAHAWLAGDPEDHDGEFTVLLRIPPTP